MAKLSWSVRQASLAGIRPAEVAVSTLVDGGVEKRGAVFTRREVVDFILDLVGYTPDKPLHEQRLLEPSFGNGDFLLVVVERLLTAWRTFGADVSALRDSIRAVELHHETFLGTHSRLDAYLCREGLTKNDRALLLGSWLIQGDFLLEKLHDVVHYVIGNPPYIRQESIPDDLMLEYRRHFCTIYDRADIYVPFIEKSLSMLSVDGVLGFICSDRWMKNRYGGPLRNLIAGNYHLKYHVDMVDSSAFLADVTAYPAITVMSRKRSGPTRVARRPEINAEALSTLARAMLFEKIPDGSGVVEVSGVAVGVSPWILESFDRLDVVRRLEGDFPTLEEAGCKVGIGVATGADRVFIAPFENLDVEPDRKLPLVMTRDIVSGAVKWRGNGVLNPFNGEGGLVSLDEYPKLHSYLRKHGDEIRKRHVSQKNPKGWFRTIDRIYPALVNRPKLLIPDIKGEAQIVFDEGNFYPHHNLYYITSSDWDLNALRALLLSGIAKLFISIYSTRMRGGYMRFQAQYLRRIRVPFWRNVPSEIRAALIAASKNRDIDGCKAMVSRLYNLNKTERVALDCIGG